MIPRFFRRVFVEPFEWAFARFYGPRGMMLDEQLKTSWARHAATVLVSFTLWLIWKDSTDPGVDVSGAAWGVLYMLDGVIVGVAVAGPRNLQHITGMLSKTVGAVTSAKRHPKSPSPYDNER